MIIRPFNKENDLLFIAEWFSTTAWPLPPVQDLLDDKYGLVAESDGVPVACGFLYLTGTSMAILSWLNSNPSASEEQQKKGLERVINEAQKMTEVIEPKVRMLTVITRSGVEIGSLETSGFRNQSGTKVLNWIKND